MSDLQVNDTSDDNPLFDRIVTILEQARDKVVRAVNPIWPWLTGLLFAKSCRSCKAEKIERNMGNSSWKSFLPNCQRVMGLVFQSPT